MRPGFINLAAVYSLTGTEDEWLTSATSATVAILTGLGETVCFMLLLFAVWDITRHGHTLALPAGRVDAAATPDAQPTWTRREVGALLALTAALVLVIGPSRRLLGKLDAVVRISRAVVFERHIAAREVQCLLLIALRPATVLIRGTPVLRPVVGFAGLSLPSGAVLLD